MLWEAQFGDFVNGAQIILDQFVVAGLSKWGETLAADAAPAARLRGQRARALQRTARAVPPVDGRRTTSGSPTRPTAAQYFHLLRRQALEPVARPLVVMTPKGLLRLREAASTLADLAEGSFQPVLDDAGADQRARAPARPLLRQGLLRHRRARAARRRRRRSPSRRIEQLYPFPKPSCARARVGSYPSLEEVVWAQEEPQNMGAWRSIRHRLEEALPSGVPLRYVGRPWRASPSEGYPTAHLREQDRIARERWASSERPRVWVAAASLRPSGAAAAPRRRPRARTGGRCCRMSAALPRRQAAPDVVRREGQTDGASRVRGSFGTPACRIRTCPSASVPTLSSRFPTKFRYNRRTEHRVPSRRRFVCRSRRRRSSVRSSRSISSSSAELGARRRHAHLELRDRGSVRQPSALQVRGAGASRGDDGRNRAGHRGGRRRRIPGRARIHSSRRRPDRASGAARATSTGATNPEPRVRWWVSTLV